MYHHFLFCLLKKKSQSSQSAGWRRWVLQITVNCGVDPWGRALNHRPYPPFLVGPLVSQSWTLQPCQPVRQTLQTCRQTLQRTSSALDVLRYVEQVAAVQNKRPARAVPSSANAKRSEDVYRSNLLVISDSVRIVSSFDSEFGTHNSPRFY